MIPCILMVVFIGIAITVPMLVIASFLLPLIVGLMVLAAKAALCTIPLMVLVALGFQASGERRRREADAAEEERRRRADIADCERKEMERNMELQAALRQAQMHRLRIEARQRRIVAEGRLEEELRLASVGPASAPRDAPRSTGWLAKIFQEIGRASGHSMDHAVSPSENCDSTEDVSLDGGNCVICRARAADTLLMPCKHLAICGACSGKMKIGSPGTEGKCPLCRVPIVEKMKIFRS